MNRQSSITQNFLFTNCFKNIRKNSFLLLSLFSLTSFATEYQLSTWVWKEKFPAYALPLKETGIGLNVINQRSFNDYLNYKDTLRFQVGYYQGSLLPTEERNYYVKHNSHVERFGWNGSFEYMLNKNFSLLSEVDIDIRSIGTFTSAWTSEGYYSFQPGVKIKPLGNDSVSLEVLQPFIKERTSYGWFTLKPKVPLLRISANVPLSQKTSFKAYVEYLTTKESSKKYINGDQYFYQPAIQKMSFNLSLNHLF